MKGRSRYKPKGGTSEEVSGSVYVSRWRRGKPDELRMRQILDNEYGKRATPDSDRTGLPGMPRRTMITS